MSNTDIINRLGATRARIEAAVHGPSVLVITSALATDGSSVLSQALAQSLTSAGHTVLLVRNDADATKRQSYYDGSQAYETDSQLRAVSSLAPTGLYSLEVARNAFQAYREKYQFTIVEAGTPSEGSALSLARAADFVLISFEAGRSAREEDRELAGALSSTGSTLLGVVTLDRKTIRDFAVTQATTSIARSRPLTGDEPLKRSSPLSSSRV